MFDEIDASPSPSCETHTVLDPTHLVREGGDYKQVTLPVNATIQDCVARWACCFLRGIFTDREIY